MKTVRITIDERLLGHVDELSRVRHTNRSAFIRDVLRAEVTRIRSRDRTARYADGRGRRPGVECGEFDVWLDEMDTGVQRHD